MTLRNRALTFGITASLVLGLCGCGASGGKELKASIEAGETLPITLANTHSTTVANPDNFTEWQRTSDIKNHQKLRLEFDTLVNTNIITKGYYNDSKQSCIYTVTNPDGTGEEVHYSNTSLMDAMLNKKFAEEYWTSSDLHRELALILPEVYKDVKGGTDQGKRALLNCYFDIINEGVDDDTYSPDLIMTREQFCSIVVRASTGKRDLIDSGYEAYKTQMGVESAYTPYAYYLDNYMYLNSQTGLTGETLQKPITKLEALYLVSKYFFSDIAESVTFDDVAYGMSCEDIAWNSGAKYEYKDPDNEEAEKEMIYRDNWVMNTLAYMSTVGHEAGIDQSLIPFVKTSEKGGLLSGINAESLYQPITKDESIQLMLNVCAGEKSINGYRTTGEYPDSSIDGTEYDTSLGNVKRDENRIEVEYISITP